MRGPTGATRVKVGLNFSSRAPLAGPLAAVELARAMRADSLWTVDHLMGTAHPVLARAGVEHLIIGNLTGLVGGGPEAALRAPDFPRPAQAIREL
jgi:hypothetical protein